MRRDGQQLSLCLTEHLQSLEVPAARKASQIQTGTDHCVKYPTVDVTSCRWRLPELSGPSWESVSRLAGRALNIAQSVGQQLLCKIGMQVSCAGVNLAGQVHVAERNRCSTWQTSLRTRQRVFVRCRSSHRVMACQKVSTSHGTSHPEGMCDINGIVPEGMCSGLLSSPAGVYA